MRRLIVATLVATLGLPAVPTGTALAAPTTLQQLLDGRVASFSGGAGVVVEDPAGAKIAYAHDPDEVVITASLYKLGVLLEAERRVEAKTLTYATEITIEVEDITDDGSYELPGTVLTLDEALEKMITVSDNGSALALLRTLGAHQINATLTTLGITPFALAENPADDNAASPRAIATYFTLLAQRKLLSAAASDRMLQRLERQQINDRLPAALPAKTVVAHKTGNLGFVTHDAGIIYLASDLPMVVVAMTWNSGEDEAIQMIRDVGALVYAKALVSPANVAFSVPQQPVPAEGGRSFVQTIRVTNLGPNRWTGGDVGVVWEMRDASGATVGASAPLLPIGDVAATASRDFPLVLSVPARSGDYAVTVGLADAAHGALATLGATTATFTISAHAPEVAELNIALSPLLHRGETASAVVTVTPRAALSTEQTLSLGWRLIDKRSRQTVRQGLGPLGAVRPGAAVTLLVPVAVPAVRGAYTLELFAVVGGEAASAVVRKDVEIAGPRTYPGEPAAGSAMPTAPRPSGSPSPRPSRTPVGKTPSP